MTLVIATLCNRIRALAVCLSLLAATAHGAVTLFVDPAGRSGGDGSREAPFASLVEAQAAARKQVQEQNGSVTVVVGAGELRLAEPLVFTPEDSGSLNAPVLYKAAPGAKVRVSATRLLKPNWERWEGNILRMKVPEGLSFDRFFVDRQPQVRARFPNYDPGDPLRSGTGYLAVVDGSNRRPDKWIEFDPKTFTDKKWSDPTTGILHAFQSVNWGNVQYRLKGIDQSKNRLLLGDGGWQMQREEGIGKGRGASSPFYIENVFEELDTAGEWFLDEKSGWLYWWPPIDAVPSEALLEAVVGKNLIEFRGTAANPVRHVSIRGLSFSASGLTFMEEYEPVTRSDWAIHRGGAVFVEGAEDCRIEDCVFDQVGGNAVFLSNYNRRVTVSGCRFWHTGESAVAVVGSDEAARNVQTWDAMQLEGKPWISDLKEIDMSPGPQTPDYPEDCVIENCIMSEIGDYGKQVAGVFISKSYRITVRHCTINGTARAGICLGDGSWGGHRIEDCDIWDTIRETGEHGPFNSWGRDRMWFREADLKRELVRLDSLAPTVIRHNRVANFRRSISAGSWTIDLDDGSSLYEITDNLSLGSTLKLRDGFFRTVRNNIFISPVPLGFHVWPEDSGDVVEENIFVVAGQRPGEVSAETAMMRPILMHPEDWASGFDRNLYWNANTGTFRVENDDWESWQERGFDPNSQVAEPRFLDPAAGDYRVNPDSPALKLGFRNFPMEGFGHRMTRIAPRGRAFENEIEIALLADARGGKIRYTLDGSEPSERSPVWEGNLILRDDTTVKALTFQEGVPVGFVAVERFEKVDEVPRPTWLDALLSGETRQSAKSKKAKGEVNYWLGAALRTVSGDGDLIDATGGQDFGLFIQELPADAPAAFEGLRPSDVVRFCNGKKLESWNDFKQALEAETGKTVRLKVRRNQVDMEFEVHLPGR